MPDYTSSYNKVILYAWRTGLVLLLFFMTSLASYAQEPQSNDSTAAYDESYKLDSAYQSPKKAAILSAVLPGLGQVYNKKYWKVPIVYAGFGTLAFFINYNQKGYLKWKQAYLDYPNYNLPYSFPLTLDQIDRTKNSFKRYRDLSIIGTAGFYLLQIIDATVDAYLFDWDVSEDISLRVEPSIIGAPTQFMLPPANTFALRAAITF